jgi:predicted glycosyltransferase involved in capsule biosynthesis
MIGPRPRGISVVIPVSSASYVPYLENCLASIADQSVGKDLFDITIVYAFNRQFREAEIPAGPLAKLAADNDATIIFHEHDYPDFPLARARNVGGRRAMRSVVGFVDADLVLDPETFETALRLTPDPCKASCVHVHRMEQGPEHAIYKERRKEVFRLNLKKGTLDPAGKGGCVFVETHTFLSIRGYDERFYGWGAEDNDLAKRLEDHKVKIAHLLTEGILAMHQFHERPKHFNPRTARNRELMATSQGVCRNDDGWGGFKG